MFYNQLFSLYLSLYREDVFMTFLLVDDQRPARNILRNSMPELGISRSYNFLEAENGEDALKLIQEHPVDFVFLDWNLNKETTGLDVLKEIRKIEKCKNVPVVMVSSDNDKTKVIEALKCGANDYVIKPIDWKVLREKVQKILKPS